MSKAVSGVRWTVRDIEVLPQNEWITYEIIDGELFVTRSPHWRHQQACGKIFRELDAWSETSGLGVAIITPGMVFSEADNVSPDVVWISNQQLALLEDDAGHLTGAPELVIEVLSPGKQNQLRDKEAKLKLYSIKGVKEYSIADRFTKQVEVYRQEDTKLVLVATLLSTDYITSPLLPNFHCLVSRFFA